MEEAGNGRFCWVGLMRRMRGGEVMMVGGIECLVVITDGPSSM